MKEDMRETLGDFNSIVCFKALITGVEDTLGADAAAVVFIRAGKVRGQAVAAKLGLAGTKAAMGELATALNAALGIEGTRLCGVKNARLDGDLIIVDTFETVCSAGEPIGADRACTFTMGALWGALESVMGKSFNARQVGFVPKGDPFDSFEFRPMN